MKKGKSLVTGLLALIALLLTLNLVQFEPQAQAETQTNLGPPPQPKVVGGSGTLHQFADIICNPHLG